MKTILKYILIFMLFTNCKAQNKPQKTTKMKTFDIETFNKHKIGNEYKFITNDNVMVVQREWQEEYEDIRTQTDSYIELYTSFYKNGMVKMEVNRFPNQFLKGMLKEYDKKGNLIKETDYDAPYKFTWEDILTFIRKIKMDNEYLRITRDVVESKPFWGITYEKEDKTGLIHIGIDGINGKIVQDEEFDYPGLD